MNETVRIEGKQIALRPITLEDTPLIVRWRSDPQVYGTLFRQEPIRVTRFSSGCSMRSSCWML